MDAQIQSVDPSQVPAWLNGTILLVVLPFSCGLAASVFMWVIVRWAITLAKVGAVLGLVLAALGFIDLHLASTYCSRLWDAILGIHRAFGQRIFALLVANPLSGASFATGALFGLVIGRRRPRPRRMEAVE